MNILDFFDNTLAPLGLQLRALTSGISYDGDSTQHRKLAWSRSRHTMETWMALHAAAVAARAGLKPLSEIAARLRGVVPSDAGIRPVSGTRDSALLASYSLQNALMLESLFVSGERKRNELVTWLGAAPGHVQQWASTHLTDRRDRLPARGARMLNWWTTLMDMRPGTPESLNHPRAQRAIEIRNALRMLDAVSGPVLKPLPEGIEVSVHEDSRLLRVEISFSRQSNLPADFNKLFDSLTAQERKPLLEVTRSASTELLTDAANLQAAIDTLLAWRKERIDQAQAKSSVLEKAAQAQLQAKAKAVLQKLSEAERAALRDLLAQESAEP